MERVASTNIFANNGRVMGYKERRIKNVLKILKLRGLQLLKEFTGTISCKIPDFAIKRVRDIQVFVRDPISGFKLLTFQLSNLRESESDTIKCVHDSGASIDPHKKIEKK